MFVVRYIFWIPFLWIAVACKFQSNNDMHPGTPDSTENLIHHQDTETVSKPLIIESGKTLQERFNPPDFYRRIPVNDNSFAAFLRNLPLKPHGTLVRYFDGQLKTPEDIYIAVVDYDIGDKDLLQCADAIMRLRGEYLYQQNRFDDIAFNFTSGDTARFVYYANGYRPVVFDNQVTWTRNSDADSSYKTFLDYMELVYQYSGTYSLDKALKIVEDPFQLTVGDVFIEGGFPGHAVLVVDIAEHITSKEKVFLLAQSYMPAQEIHILCNPESRELSPWYKLAPYTKLVTPQWVFDYSQLKRFGSDE